MKRFFQDESGASAVEYGLLVALIAVVIIGAVTALGTSLKNMFQGVSNTISAVPDPLLDSVSHNIVGRSTEENQMKRFFQDESGASAVEYGLLVALIAVVIIGAVTALGTSLKNMFPGVSNTISAVPTTS